MAVLAGRGRHAGLDHRSLDPDRGHLTGRAASACRAAPPARPTRQPRHPGGFGDRPHRSDTAGPHGMSTLCTLCKHGTKNQTTSTARHRRALSVQADLSRLSQQPAEVPQAAQRPRLLPHLPRQPQSIAAMTRRVGRPLSRCLRFRHPSERDPPLGRGCSRGASAGQASGPAPSIEAGISVCWGSVWLSRGSVGWLAHRMGHVGCR